MLSDSLPIVRRVDRMRLLFAILDPIVVAGTLLLTASLPADVSAANRSMFHNLTVTMLPTVALLFPFFGAYRSEAMHDSTHSCMQAVGSLIVVTLLTLLMIFSLNAAAEINWYALMLWPVLAAVLICSIRLLAFSFQSLQEYRGKHAQSVLREGFRRLLQLDSEFEVVGEARDGLQAIEMVQALRPEVVLMDIAMPILNGLTAAKQMLKSVPATKILILSAHGDSAYVSGAAESGAKGFLLKQSSAMEVGQAIRAVHSGQPFYSVRVPGRSGSSNGSHSDHQRLPDTKAVRLTARELEVLQLISEGKANKEAAVRLQIAVKTIEKHRENLMRKLGIHDTAGLTRYAISAGIIESSVQVTTL